MSATANNEHDRSADINLSALSSVFRAVCWSAPAIPAITALILSTCWDYRFPGIYMDAVNPDYLVVNAINSITSFAEWTLPGTMIFGKFPTIIQLYHGALTFYIGLPVYALFGTGLMGIRITNTVFAVLVLSSAFVALRAICVRPFTIAFVLLCLALDPGFIFSFRTQFYITLLPISLVLLSIVFNIRAGLNNNDHWKFLSGLASGLSVYGYFIYTFLAPALLLQLIFTTMGRMRSFLLWSFGFLIGASPYALGYALILRSVGGVAQFREFIAQNMSSLGVVPSTMSIIESISNIRSMLIGTILDFGPSVMMLHTFASNSFPYLKVVFLIVVPTIYAVLAVFSAQRKSPILTIFGLLGGFCLLFLIFGKRLWLHHAIPSLPLMYVGLALALEAFLLACSRNRGLRIGGASLVCVLQGFLLVANVLDRHAMFVGLEKTGGVGLASDAIVHFAEENVSQATPTKAFFPDWGIFMPFEMITSGATAVRTDFSPNEAVMTLCAGQDVLLGTIEGKSSGQVAAWKDAVGWGEPVIRVYNQKDGTPVLTAVRWSASASHQTSCP